MSDMDARVDCKFGQVFSWHSLKTYIQVIATEKLKLSLNFKFYYQVKNVRKASLFYICPLQYLSLTEEMANGVACALVQTRADCADSLYTRMSSANFWQAAVGA